jgi:hypothetical protein
MAVNAIVQHIRCKGLAQTVEMMWRLARWSIWLRSRRELSDELRNQLAFQSRDLSSTVPKLSNCLGISSYSVFTR